MKIRLIFVTTLDGKVTKWGDPHVFHWSSKEDQRYFMHEWNSAKVIIMGSSTFAFDPVKPSPERLLIVMTSTPEKYKQYLVPGQVEFTKESPVEIADRLKAAGHPEILLVGGAHIASAYLAEGLVDEFWLTFEPRIFGTGGNFVSEKPLDVKLKLTSIEKVNEQGTLIAKYAIEK